MARRAAVPEGSRTARTNCRSEGPKKNQDFGPRTWLMHEVETPRGTARVLMQYALEPKGALVLGHGAGGSVSAPDLQAATRVALEEDISVALVEQPYRVAGRRSAPPPPHLDEAWLAAIQALDLRIPLISGGRSSGARVACRTAALTS